ncbi:HTTM domain-containing protein [uncultured Formosa sp.]|uniref:HTTM domain-containing protein n=1 Tax=uncultured Formosa sp. TaxID=255435 RepID=UPI00262A0C3D|nr:HTTM domain-containing protein [uncultured Formosa sp.]
MEFFEKINTLTTSVYFPLRVTNTAMLPNILLLCKLAFIMLCLYGFVGKMDDPYIPFLKVFDNFHVIPNVYKVMSQIIFVTAGVLLLCNVRVRTMAFLLGLITLLVLLSSKPIFRNHLFILGCFFLLAGLSNRLHDPWLLYIQFALIYIGAVINKTPQLDWWTGQFMDNWLRVARENQTYITIASWLPDLMFAKLLSWSSMCLEFTIAILILNKNTQNIAVWAILIFHTLLYTLTIHRFGHFYEDIVLGLLIFLDWPKDKLLVALDDNQFKTLKKALVSLNFNRHIHWSPDAPKLERHWFEIRISDKVAYNWNGIRTFLLYSSNFYIVLFGLDFFIRYTMRLLFNNEIMHITQIVVTWAGILFFLPMLWNALKTKRQS